jgi:adenylate kinase
MKIFVMGAPGSGKSTQARLLAKELGIPHLSTGEICRAIAAEDNQRGRFMKQIVDSGGLVPDREMLKIAHEWVKKPKYKKGIILDGTPRSLWQAENFKLEFDKVFYFEVSDQEGLKRLLKRAEEEDRKDDTEEVVKGRLVLYHQTTEPMLDFYRQKGILEKVDGERPVEKIFEDILGRLKKAGLAK